MKETKIDQLKNSQLQNFLIRIYNIFEILNLKMVGQISIPNFSQLGIEICPTFPTI